MVYERIPWAFLKTPVSFSPDSDSYRGSYFQYGGGRRTTLADWTWHQGAIAGAVDVVPLLGAIVRYHCSVLCLGGRVTTNFNFGGMDVVPLLGAIAGCHCSVLWCGEGRVTTNFGGVDVVPLLGAIVGCLECFG